jgi:hypothetical protein
VHNAEEERRATERLSANGAEHVHVHSLPATKFALTGGESYDMSFMKALGL